MTGDTVTVVTRWLWWHGGDCGDTVTRVTWWHGDCDYGDCGNMVTWWHGDYGDYNDKLSSKTLDTTVSNVHLDVLKASHGSLPEHRHRRNTQSVAGIDTSHVNLTKLWLPCHITVLFVHIWPTTRFNTDNHVHTHSQNRYFMTMSSISPHPHYDTTFLITHHLLRDRDTYFA